MKGLVYASEELGPGWVVFVDGVLLHRKLNPEEGGGAFCRLIDRDTLKVGFQEDLWGGRGALFLGRGGGLLCKLIDSLSPPIILPP